MSKFKLLLLGLIISILSIGSFTSAGFEESVSGNDCQSSQCSFDGFSYISSPCSFQIQIHCGMGIPNSKFNAGNITIQDLQAKCKSMSDNANLNLSYGFHIHSSSCLDSTRIVYSSDKMPVSVLSPVLDGLSGALLEFVPYVVYVGLGVLGVLIGFFSIKRLINWVRRQSLGVFSSRKKK